MSLLEIFLTGVGLAMDAFAVSICKGLAIGKVRPGHMILAGLWFGLFQALMPILGFLAGSFLSNFVSAWSPWIAFILLAIIGGNMIREAGENEEADASMAPLTMFLLAVATSIDAFAVGASLALLGGDIRVAAPIIGLTTFCISAAGVKIGGIFGSKWGKASRIAGGIILILIGIRILISGLLGA